jgi:hypothetical protein
LFSHPRHALRAAGLFLLCFFFVGARALARALIILFCLTTPAMTPTTHVMID